MPKISIITPTMNRERFLPAIWDCVRNQSVQDFEWLVHDSSAPASQLLTGLEASDGRVRYLHDPGGMSIGAKRNALCAAATGNFIIHMDDDDHYAPGYVEGMLSLLAREKADIVKLFGFHLYHRKSGNFAYWDLEHGFPLHYIMHPHFADLYVAEKPVGPNEPWGYGFSHVYGRHVWDAIRFADENHGEDQLFADQAVARFKGKGMQDRSFLAVHVLHDSNTSISYPQQLLPHDFGQAYFPGFTPPPVPASSVDGL